MDSRTGGGNVVSVFVQFGLNFHPNELKYVFALVDICIWPLDLGNLYMGCV